MKKVFLSLITIFMVLTLSIVLVKANTKTTVVIEEGVQIRTDGNNGLKWVANVTNHKDSNVYGFLFAQGELTEVNIKTANVVNQLVEGVTAEEPVMSATMTKFPKSAVTQDISVVAYVKDGDAYTYSNVVVRNLAEVALGAKNKNLEGTFITDVVDYVGSNYKKTFNIDDTIFVNNPLYESNPVEIEKLFVADWNAKFGTNWVEINYSTFRASAADGSTPLKETGDANCSGTNMYEFFNTDTITSSKWKWLIEYMIGVAGGKVHPLRQANALLGDGTKSDSYGSGMQNFMHLAASITNFFNGGSSRDANNDIVFSDSKYSKIEDYNKKIYSTDPTLIKINENLTLKSLIPTNGYSFEGYLEGENSYVNSYTITPKSVTLVPSYKTINYTIKYLYNSDELLLTPSQYTIEDDDISLPIYVKDGYQFLGWYTSSTFEEDTKVDKIIAGSYEDKVFYAKVEETPYANVNVTFDINGGYWNSEIILENASILKEATLTRYLSYTSDGSEASLYTGKILPWWHYIGLTETIVPNVYEIAASGAAGGTSLAHSYDFIIIWHDNHSNSTNESALGTIKSSYVGKYVILENIPDSSSTCSIKVKVIEPSELSKTISKTYVNEANLPIPIKSGQVFAGWKSSVDNSIIKKYPGYTSNPGDVIYTAQWKTQIDTVVTYDFNGGVSEELYKNNGTVSTKVTVNAYNRSDFWGDSKPYIDHIFINTSSTDPKATYSKRIYIGKDNVTGLYTVINTLASGASSSWPAGAEYVITISGSYTGTGDDNFNLNNLSNGDIVIFDNQITNANTTPVTLLFYKKSITNEKLTIDFANEFIMPEAKKKDYKFLGWEDLEGNLYDELNDFIGVSTITLIAKWSSSIVISYDTDPFTEVGNTIQLNAQIVGTLVGNFVWESKNTNIATIDQTGLVTGVKEGTVDIYVYDSLDPSVNLTIQISIVSEGLGELFSIISDAHNDTIFKKLDLRIGTKTEGYNADIYGSVSKILFNKPLYIDEKYLANGIATGNYYLNSVKDTGLEFITVHYTAGFPASSDTDNNASYFTTKSAGVSIHYVTGNNGTYSDGTQSSSVYKCMSHDHGAWHAGDSNARYYSNSNKTNSSGQLIFSWMPTGVAYDGADLMDIEWSASTDFYFEINGKKTKIKLPSTWDKYNKDTDEDGIKDDNEFRHTDHIYNSDGTISAQSDYSNWGSTFSNRTPESFFNEQGFPVKVINGEYYMGPTWWSYGQVYEGRICGTGGNLNSIGIESCVNEGSDLWLTWQTTAQLVAKLCYENGLGFERIKGHHFFDGKDCPQPLLANDMEIWNEFIELVKYEYELLTKFSNYTITFVSNNTEYVSNTGRIIKVPAKDTTVSYTITLTDKTSGVSNSLTYFSTIPGSN